VGWACLGGTWISAEAMDTVGTMDKVSARRPGLVGWWRQPGTWHTFPRPTYPRTRS